MGNLNCNYSTLDNQNEIKTEDFNRNKTYISKNNNLIICAPIRSMIKSKTIPPKKHLSLQEKNFIFLDINKNKELKNNEKYIRRSFTPRRREQFKISSDVGISIKKEENKILDFKNNKKSKEKENKDSEDNDVNKKSAILKKVKSSPLEVICEQIEDEKKILDTTKTFKNKEKNINDKNNNSIILNNIKDNDKTQKDLILNDSNENNNNSNQNDNNLKLNNSNYYSDKSNNSENNKNENNNKENSIINKEEMKLCFNHTSSSKGEEENYVQEEEQNNNYYYNNELPNDNYNNINGFIENENKDSKKNLVKEKYKELYKKKPYKNRFYKELNWKNININLLLLSKKENDILLQGEFLVLNNILEINSFVHSKYSRYLTLTKHELNIFRSKEKYLYNGSPLINISLFNITKCDLLNKNDINMFNNLKNLLLKFSLYIKLTTVTGMIIFEPSNNTNKRYRFSNPFIKSNFNKPKSLNKYTSKPKDIELIPEIISKYNIKNNNLANSKNDKTKINEKTNKDKNKSGFYIIISSDNSELILYLVAIINYLRK